MRIEKLGEFFKVKDGIAYGWAVISTIKGKPYVDLHGDHIPPETLASVAAEFMTSLRVGKDMHKGEQIADIPFCLPIDGDVEKGLGLSDGAQRTGLVIGWRPHDPAVLAKIESGERIGFSIGGWLAESDEVESKGFQKHASATQKSKVRVFRSWKLCEISLVDRPAQEGALVGLVKRAPLAVAAKSALYTTETEGHQHLIDLSCFDSNGSGQTSWNTASGAEYGHGHAVVRGSDGTLTILADSGHTHDLAEGQEAVVVVSADAVVVVQASANNDARSDAHNKSTPSIAVRTVKGTSEENHVDPKDEQIATLRKTLAATLVLASLTDAQRAHHSTLKGADADAFLAKSHLERETVLKAAADADAPIFKGEMTGIAVRASDGALALQLAKQNEENAKAVKAANEAVAKANELRETAELEKRADKELAWFGKSVKVRAAVLKAVDAIADEAVRKEAHEGLAGTKAAVEYHMKAIGATEPGKSADDSPVAKFNTKLNEFAKAANKTPQVATSDFLGTAEGAQLYADAFPAVRA